MPGNRWPGPADCAASVVAQSRLPTATVSDLARIIYENKAELALPGGFASKIEPAATDKDAFIVAHPGALPRHIASLLLGVLRPDRTEWSVHVLLPIESVGVRAVGRINGLG